MKQRKKKRGAMEPNMPYIVIFFSWITAGVGLGLMLWDRHSQWGARSALVLVPVLVCASHGERV